MKRTTIFISHEGTSTDAAAIEKAFDWLRQQMTSTGLLECNEAVMSTSLGATFINFKIFEASEKSQIAPIEPTDISNNPVV